MTPIQKWLFIGIIAQVALAHLRIDWIFTRIGHVDEGVQKPLPRSRTLVTLVLVGWGITVVSVFQVVLLWTRL